MSGIYLREIDLMRRGTGEGALDLNMIIRDGFDAMQASEAIAKAAGGLGKLVAEYSQEGCGIAIIDKGDAVSIIGVYHAKDIAALPDACTAQDDQPVTGGKSIRIIDTEKLADARGLLHDIRCLPKDADIELAQAWAKQAGELLAAPYDFQADVAARLADLNITDADRAIAAQMLQDLRDGKSAGRTEVIRVAQAAFREQTRGAVAAKPPCRCISYNRPDWGGDVEEIVVSVPSHIRKHTDGRETVCLDLCIAPLVIMLWAHDIPTLGSCCSHCGRVSRDVIVPEAYATKARAIADAMGDDADILYWPKTGSIVRIGPNAAPAVACPPEGASRLEAAVLSRNSLKHPR